MFLRNVSDTLTDVDWKCKGGCDIVDEDAKVEKLGAVGFQGCGVYDVSVSEYFMIR